MKLNGDGNAEVSCSWRMPLCGTGCAVLTTLPPKQATAQGRSAPLARKDRRIRPIPVCLGLVVSKENPTFALSACQYLGLIQASQDGSCKTGRSFADFVPIYDTSAVGRGEKFLTPGVRPLLDWILSPISYPGIKRQDNDDGIVPQDHQGNVESPYDYPLLSAEFALSSIEGPTARRSICHQ